MSNTKDISGVEQDSSGVIFTEQHEKIIRYVCSNTNLTRNQAINGLQMFKGNYNKVIQIATANHLIELVMRQTTYTREEAMEKLKEYNGEPVDVIRNFMGIKVDKKEVPKTANQMIFHEIRNFMDDVNKKYNQRKERSDKIKEIQQKFLASNNGNKQ